MKALESPVAARAARPTYSWGSMLVMAFVASAFLVPITVVLPGPLRSNGSPAVLISLVMAALLAYNFAIGQRSDHRGIGVTMVLVASTMLLITWAVAESRYLEAGVSASVTRGLIILVSYTAACIGTILWVRTAYERRAMLCVLVVVMSFSGVVGILQAATSYNGRDLFKPPGLVVNGDPTFNIRGGFVRVLGTSGSPIEYGATMACLLALALTLLRSSAGRTVRIVSIIGIVVAIVGVPYSVSRTGVLCLATVALVYVFSLRVRFISIAAAGLTLLLLGFYAAEPARFHELIDLFTKASSDDSVLGRTDDYAVVAASFHQHPWLGTGLATTPPSAYRYLDNQWLQAALQGGSVGLIATALQFFTGVFATTAPKSHPHRIELVGYLAVLVAIFVSSFTFDLFAFSQARYLLFLVIGLAWSARAQVEPDPTLVTSSRES